MTYSGTITKLKPNENVAVGTNTQGRHGKGAALWAFLHAGLKRGHSLGQCGQTYGIVTKDLTQAIHPSISRRSIVFQLTLLYIHAYQHPDQKWFVLYSGTGANLNGYTPAEMRQLFRDAEKDVKMPPNIIFEETFAILLPPTLQKLQPSAPPGDLF
jgi:hypothetical protein